MSEILSLLSIEQQALSSGNEKPNLLVDRTLLASKKHVETKFFDQSRKLKAPGANQVPIL
jgi:hypothetical protein